MWCVFNWIRDHVMPRIEIFIYKVHFRFLLKVGGVMDSSKGQSQHSRCQMWLVPTRNYKYFIQTHQQRSFCLKVSATSWWCHLWSSQIKFPPLKGPLLLNWTLKQLTLAFCLSQVILKCFGPFIIYSFSTKDYLIWTHSAGIFIQLFDTKFHDLCSQRPDQVIQIQQSLLQKPVSGWMSYRSYLSVGSLCLYWG